MQSNETCLQGNLLLYISYIYNINQIPIMWAIDRTVACFWCGLQSAQVVLEKEICSTFTSKAATSNRWSFVASPVHDRLHRKSNCPVLALPCFTRSLCVFCLILLLVVVVLLYFCSQCFVWLQFLFLFLCSFSRPSFLHSFLDNLR